MEKMSKEILFCSCASRRINIKYNENREIFFVRSLAIKMITVRLIKNLNTFQCLPAGVGDRRDTVGVGRVRHQLSPSCAFRCVRSLSLPILSLIALITCAAYNDVDFPSDFCELMRKLKEKSYLRKPRQLTL